MIAEAVDTLFTLGWALLVWILLLAAVGTLAVWTVGYGMWRAGRVLWALMPRRGAWWGSGAPHGASRGSRDAGSPQRAVQSRTAIPAPHAPSWAHTDHEEAA